MVGKRKDIEVKTVGGLILVEPDDAEWRVIPTLTLLDPNLRMLPYLL